MCVCGWVWVCVCVLSLKHAVPTCQGIAQTLPSPSYLFIHLTGFIEYLLHARSCVRLSSPILHFFMVKASSKAWGWLVPGPFIWYLVSAVWPCKLLSYEWHSVSPIRGWSSLERRPYIINLWSLSIYPVHCPTCIRFSINSFVNIDIMSSW